MSQTHLAGLQIYVVINDNDRGGSYVNRIEETWKRMEVGTLAVVGKRIILLLYLDYGS